MKAFPRTRRSRYVFPAVLLPALCIGLVWTMFTLGWKLRKATHGCYHMPQLQLL